MHFSFLKLISRQSPGFNQFHLKDRKGFKYICHLYKMIKMFYPLHNLGDYFLFHISKGLDEKHLYIYIKF